MVGQCLSTMLMLVSMHWFIFLLNLPIAAWNIYRYALMMSMKIPKMLKTNKQKKNTAADALHGGQE